MNSLQVLFVLIAALTSQCVCASVYMAPSSSTGSGRTLTASSPTRKQLQQEKNNRYELRWALKSQQASSVSSSLSSVGGRSVVGMAIPGYSVPEQIFVGGFLNFLSIYNLVITGRILLSWFPQAQGIGVLQPVFAVTDPYLNLFRGIVPPIFGLDLSPILAFVTLNALTSATVAIGAEIPPNLLKQINEKQKSKKYFGIRIFQKKSNNFPLI
jgi:uncharacterized protein YggT (Ycf19 family)